MSKKVNLTINQLRAVQTSFSLTVVVVLVADFWRTYDGFNESSHLGMVTAFALTIGTLSSSLSPYKHWVFSIIIAVCPIISGAYNYQSFNMNAVKAESAIQTNEMLRADISNLSDEIKHLESQIASKNEIADCKNNIVNGLSQYCVHRELIDNNEYIRSQIRSKTNERANLRAQIDYKTPKVTKEDQTVIINVILAIALPLLGVGSCKGLAYSFQLIPYESNASKPASSWNFPRKSMKANESANGSKISSESISELEGFTVDQHEKMREIHKTLYIKNKGKPVRVTHLQSQAKAERVEGCRRFNLVRQWLAENNDRLVKEYENSNILLTDQVRKALHDLYQQMIKENHHYDISLKEFLREVKSRKIIDKDNASVWFEDFRVLPEVKTKIVNMVRPSHAGTY